MRSGDVIKFVEIAGAWGSYFVLHSLLAADATKAWVARHWPHLLPGYRAAFNLISLVALLPVLWLVYSGHGAWLWRWHGTLAWLVNGAALAALLIAAGPDGPWHEGWADPETALQARRTTDQLASVFHRYQHRSVTLQAGRQFIRGAHGHNFALADHHHALAGL